MARLRHVAPAAGFVGAVSLALTCGLPLFPRCGLLMTVHGGGLGSGGVEVALQLPRSISCGKVGFSDREGGLLAPVGFLGLIVELVAV